MKEFEYSLNYEIVEAGRVPHKDVIATAKSLGEVFENHYPEIELEIYVDPVEDKITVSGEITEDSGFKLNVKIKDEDQKVEEELIVWHSSENVFINIKGTLAIKDFEYALNRQKDYVYLDEPIK